MDRKLNLAKIAGKNSNITKSIENAIKNTAQPQSGTESPYFSPVAGHTRNKRNDDAKSTSGIKLKSTETKPASASETVGKIEKKLATELQKTKSRKHVKVEYEENENPVVIKKEIKKEPNDDQLPPKGAKKRSSGGTKADNIKSEPKVKTESGVSDDSASPEKQVKWEPNNWRELLANIREMRKERTAPVDTMGCEKCHDEYSDEKTKRFHHLVALMLSSQTKDAVTYAAMSRLRRHGLTPEEMVKTSTNDLEQLLYPVGFYKTKAKHIQKTSQILIDQFQSDIPNDIKGLVSLPGVGPKMAHICMRVAWNIVTGIGVDVHVHRISNRLKWVPKETKEPEQTRIVLEKWLPFEEWAEVNELLVGFGQTICTPTNPHCGECLNAHICPSSNVKNKKKA
ncbi:endonuclease III-like protein 1 [Sitodiplosis mosellana]|uniref:endonuclease III-like protein 1 n=1 Tax=Sitodiplosis mosellana TaxID=263140 RepID=UPI002443DE8F|nr:endonuclease III-like protein 1 [Sitodiplosis mosellana]